MTLAYLLADGVYVFLSAGEEVQLDGEEKYFAVYGDAAAAAARHGFVLQSNWQVIPA